MGDGTPGVHAVAPRQFPIVIPPYAWYIRVPDLPAFLRRIAPVLERRLVASVVAGHTGELALSFYRTGIRLTFADGRSDRHRGVRARSP